MRSLVSKEMVKAALFAGTVALLVFGSFVPSEAG